MCNCVQPYVHEVHMGLKAGKISHAVMELWRSKEK